MFDEKQQAKWCLGYRIRISIVFTVSALLEKKNTINSFSLNVYYLQGVNCLQWIYFKIN